ncbi:MAG: type II toxin-antitoxin system VapC family toxin [Treponema sp.]|nr:type II toxin-antitoxin system VapC family toxin [Treponema sp.]
MNNLLLDTNALLWFFEGSPRMDSVRELFSMPDTRVYVSTVSWWEIAIKVRIGKLPIRIPLLLSFADEYDFHELPLTRDFLPAYLKLPNLHKDPFDHMLLAQAITCPMYLITGDSQLAEYSSLVKLI